MPSPDQSKRRTRHTGDKATGLKMPTEFAGMNETECCTGCSADRCIISGANFCGHPLKGGQSPHNDNDALVRSLRAKKALAHRKLDVKDQVEETQGMVG